MRALIPPKHDLRGGKASADSFAISSTVFVASMMRCLLAEKSNELAECDNIFDLVHELGSISFSLAVWRGFLRSLDMIESGRDVRTGFVVFTKVEA
jgi:hypothetical protein